jgi:RNA polymerase sigma-70 factor, ECF subfamily
MTDPNQKTEMFNRYRPLLFSIAYRMLSSTMEAEDLVQDAYLRYLRVPETEIVSPKAYLTAIITRLCLDALKSAKEQREDYVGFWLPEPLITEMTPDSILGDHETIAMAFLILLEQLSPLERAVFLLHEVFDFSHAEIAEIIGKNEAYCRQLLRRAKQHIDEQHPRFEPSSDEHKRIVDDFLRAIIDGDVAALTQRLAEDVVFYADGGGKVKAITRPVYGSGAVVPLLLGLFRQLPGSVRFERVEANGTPSLMVWGGDRLLGLVNLLIVEERFHAIYNIVNPDKLVSVLRSR